MAPADGFTRLYEATQAGAREEWQNWRFAGLSTFGWYKLPRYGFDTLKTKNPRNFWIYT